MMPKLPGNDARGRRHAERARNVVRAVRRSDLSTPCSAEADVDRELHHQRLGIMISRLSPTCRAVPVMRYRDDLSYREIAELWSISTNMVKKYLVKGWAACRQRMADDE
jgi:RNA polymerase sigma-70 factor (ECF subfamily)